MKGFVTGKERSLVEGFYSIEWIYLLIKSNYLEISEIDLSEIIAFGGRVKCLRLVVGEVGENLLKPPIRM